VRFERVLVAEHADVAHAGGGHHAQHTVHQTETGAQDGNDGELLAGQHGNLGLADGGLHRGGGQGQVTGGLIGDEHTDFAHQLAEILDAGVLVAHDGQLVCNQGVIHDVYFFAKHRSSPHMIKF